MSNSNKLPNKSPNRLTLGERVEQIFSVLAKANPSPATELVYSTSFELLIAVVLSAQATDISVNKATEILFAVANTPQQILDLGLERLQYYIKTIGLYRNKAKHIIGLCNQLLTQYNGEVPSNFEDLTSLSGVGRKTANVILNNLHGEPRIAVDTHVFRVSNRLGIATGKTTLQVETKLDKVVPHKFKPYAHHWLILHGRYVCKARKPDCMNCAIHEYCDYFL
jgi:endonuclease-3